MSLCSCGCGKETPISNYDRKSRGYKKGDHQKYILGHDRHTGKMGVNNGYLICRGKFAHKTVAEKIYGELPPGAIVHHRNEDKKDNSPVNLKVLLNAKEHAIEHQMMRAFVESGHADWKQCVICKKWDDPENLSKPTKSRRSRRHKECHRMAELIRRNKNRRNKNGTK